jgi:hypothetical protein
MGPPTILTAEEASSLDRLREVFAASSLLSEMRRFEGVVELDCQGMPCWVSPSNDGDMIHLWLSLGTEDWNRLPRQEKLVRANRINNELRLLKAAVGEDGILECRGDIPIFTGVTAEAVVEAARFFIGQFKEASALMGASDPGQEAAEQVAARCNEECQAPVSVMTGGRNGYLAVRGAHRGWPRAAGPDREGQEPSRLDSLTEAAPVLPIAVQSGETREDRPMAGEREALRDWHRLFGLLLTDFFTGLPFTVEVERDLSQQQQFLDVVIVRRGRGRVALRLPDGLDDLAKHNLITFKSHHEALDGWAMKELIGHYVAYRKLVSPSLSELLAEEHFRLYAVCARFPEGLSGQVPWQARQAGVYDCQWGTDAVRVVVAGQLPREAHNAPLHLFSASPALVGFGQTTYRRRSENTSLVLGQLFERLRGEGFTMSFTMEDFKRQLTKEYFHKLSPKEQQEMFRSLPVQEQQKMFRAMPAQEQQKMFRSLPAQERRELLKSWPAEERRELLESLPPEERLAGLPPEQRLAGLSAEQIQQYLNKLTAGRSARPRKPRRKK